MIPNNIGITLWSRKNLNDGDKNLLSEDCLFFFLYFNVDLSETNPLFLIFILFFF